MISVENVYKEYHIHTGKSLVLKDVSFTLAKGEKIGILGRNGAGKSTLIRLISGAEKPTSGRIRRTMSISWPLAFAGGFQGSLTGLDNLKFLCRIYNTDYRDKIDFVEDFSELGKYMREPVKTYSSGMRARLAFALSMAIDFDCFLIDEVVAVGDSRFHEKCNIELFERRKDRAMIMVSHNDGYIAQHCDRASVLIDGNLYNFDTTHEAIGFYHNYLSPPQEPVAPPQEIVPQIEEIV